MPLFKILIVASNRPEHQEELPALPVLEFIDMTWAEDYAYMLTDKGEYVIVEVENKENCYNG